MIFFVQVRSRLLSLQLFMRAWSRLCQRVNLRTWFLLSEIWSHSSSCIGFTGYSLDMSIPTVKTFCLELDDGPVYFRQDGCAGSSDRQLVENGIFQEKNVYYISSFATESTFARNIHQHERLREILEAALTENYEVMPGMAYTTEIFERGYFLSSTESYDDLFCRLKEPFKKEELKIAPLIKFVADLMGLDPQVEKKENVASGDKYDQPAIFKVGSAIPVPDVHPAFLSRETNSVYHCIEKCFDVLNEFGSREEVKDLKEICAKYIETSPSWKEKLPLRHKYPVIVIEGLDATGKTTLTKNLGERLGATVLKSPANCLCHLRAKFDSYPQLLRRAFYSLGNYAFAKMVHDAADDGIVIVDRFWNSTAAYAIATDVGTGGPECLPPVGHPVYSWPSDLLKPSAVFLLTVSDEERRRRLNVRGTAKTDEEIRLEMSSPFRQRLEEAYNRMCNPTMQKLDASGTVEDVFDKALETLKLQRIIRQADTPGA